MPGLSGKAGAFAHMLEGALKSGGTDALSIIAQSTLDGQFLTQMTGQEAGKLSELGDVTAFVDSLTGASEKSGGLDLMGLLGSGMPTGGGMDMSKMAGLLGSMSRNDPASMVGGAQMNQFVAQAERALSKQAEHDLAAIAQAENTTPDLSKSMSGAAQSVAGPQAVAAPAAPTAPVAPPRVDAAVRAQTEAAFGQSAARTFKAANAALARKAYGAGAAPGGMDAFGDLSARFESGGEPGSVGYDRVGGTSYGIYQISSKAGTFDRFLSYLDAKAPDMAARLHAAGDADTGSKTGPMPSAWKTLAHEQGERFARLQHDFIKESHFQPALKKISDLTGVDLSARHQAVAQVLWSTAVQHGATGSANIFARALEAVGGLDTPGFDKQLIEAVYAARSRQFGSSTDHVKGAVQSRFKGELKAALSMLGGADGVFDSNV